MTKSERQDNNGLLSVSDIESDEPEEEEKEKETATQTLYHSIMDDRDFILTFQTKKLEGLNSESEEEDNENKLMQASSMGGSMLESKMALLTSKQQTVDLGDASNSLAMRKSRMPHKEELMLEDMLRERWYIVADQNKYR
jgi:hypothetical protein